MPATLLFQSLGRHVTSHRPSPTLHVATTVTASAAQDYARCSTIDYIDDFMMRRHRVSTPAPREHEEPMMPRNFSASSPQVSRHEVYGGALQHSRITGGIYAPFRARRTMPSRRIHIVRRAGLFRLSAVRQRHSSRQHAAACCRMHDGIPYIRAALCARAVDIRRHAGAPGMKPASITKATHEVVGRFPHHAASITTKASPIKIFFHHFERCHALTWGLIDAELRRAHYGPIALGHARH